MRRIAQLSLVTVLACDGTFPSDRDLVDGTAIGSEARASHTGEEILCAGDVTMAIQRHLEVGESIVISGGTCDVTDTLRVATSNLTIEGAGPHVTIVVFKPTVAKPLFEFEGTSATPVENVMLKGIGMRSGKNYDVAKTAVSIRDARHFAMENVSILTWAADNADTTGIEIHGIELSTLRKLRVESDVPLRIGPANVPGIHDASHLHFEDANLISSCAPDPVIVIDPGVVLRNVTFDGYQEWRNGGFRWTEAAASRGRSNHLRIANVRVEGLCDTTPPGDPETSACFQNVACQQAGLDDHPWGIDIQKNSASKLDTLWVESSLTASRGLGNVNGPASNGIRVSGVGRTVLSQVVFEGQFPSTQAVKPDDPATVTYDP